MIINNIEYIHGADHAGLTIWISRDEADQNEKRGVHMLGDLLKDELICYLANPDDWYERGPRRGLLITDERMRPWPLRNMHRGGGSNRREATPQGKPAVRPTQGSPAPVCAPASAEASYPGVRTYRDCADWEVVWVYADTYQRVRVDGRWHYSYDAEDRGNHVRVDGPERLAIIASLIASVPAAAKLLGARDDSPYEPVEVQPRKGDRMRNVETGETCIARTDAYVPSGCFRALWKTRLQGRKCHAETYGDGSNEGWRILRRSAPDAGKVVGRGE
jgi:hypothetical protein